MPAWTNRVGPEAGGPSVPRAASTRCGGLPHNPASNGPAGLRQPRDAEERAHQHDQGRIFGAEVAVSSGMLAARTDGGAGQGWPLSEGGQCHEVE